MMGNFPVIRTELRLLFEKNFSIGNFPIRNFPVIRTEQIGEPINTAYLLSAAVARTKRKYSSISSFSLNFAM